MYHVKQSAISTGRDLMQTLQMTPNAAQKLGWKVNQDGQRRSAWDYLAYPSISMADVEIAFPEIGALEPDRKSTRLNSSHQIISYAVFCLKKKKKKKNIIYI